MYFHYRVTTIKIQDLLKMKIEDPENSGHQFDLQKNI